LASTRSLALLAFLELSTLQFLGLEQDHDADTVAGFIGRAVPAFSSTGNEL
jgi:hypothetical protein